MVSYLNILYYKSNVILIYRYIFYFMMTFKNRSKVLGTYIISVLHTIQGPVRFQRDIIIEVSITKYKQVQDR